MRRLHARPSASHRRCRRSSAFPSTRQVPRTGHPRGTLQKPLFLTAAHTWASPELADRTQSPYEACAKPAFGHAASVERERHSLVRMAASAKLAFVATTQPEQRVRRV